MRRLRFKRNEDETLTGLLYEDSEVSKDDLDKDEASHLV